MRISGIKKRKRQPFPFLMPATGIEPVLCHHNRILSPARLPVPPRGQAFLSNYIKKVSLHNHNENGQRWIRTTEAICSRFTVCPLWPLGNLPIYQSLIVLTNIDYSITPCCVQGVFMHFLHFLFCHFLFFRILSFQNDSCMLWQCNIQSSIDDVIADRRNGVSIFTGKKYLF